MIVFEPVFHWIASIAVVAAFALAVAFAYRISPSYLSGGRRMALVALRFTALVCVALGLFRPILQRPAVSNPKSVLAFLIDGSESMSIQDGYNNVSRRDALESVFEHNQYTLDRLRKKFDVRFYTFADEVSVVEEPEFAAGGASTRIGAALQSVVRSDGKKTMAALVLCSDGVNTAGVEPSEMVPVLRSEDIPVFALALGEQKLASAVHDVVVESVSTNPVARLNNVVPVEARVGLIGVAGRSVEVKLLVDGEEMDSSIVTARKAYDQVMLPFRFTPSATGFRRLTVEAQSFDDEVVTTNNSAETLIQAIDRGLRVLYIEGQPRWQYRFLRRDLETAADMSLSIKLLLGAGERTVAVEPAVLTEDPIYYAEALPEVADGWRQFHVVLLGDVPADRFTEAQLSSLAEAVSDGLGLIAMGATGGFAAGGYGNTPIADALPVAIRADEGEVEGKFRVTRTTHGAAAELLRLGDEAEEDRLVWATLPVLDGAVLFRAVKPGATVLAETEDHTPLLVTEFYGSGRTAVWAPFSTVPWTFSEKDFSDYHKRFWRQLVLWAANFDTRDRERVWIELPSQQFQIGEDVPVKIHVRDEEGNPVVAAEVLARLLRGLPPATSQLSRLDEWSFTGTYDRTIKAEEAGFYTVEAAAEKDGSSVGEARAAFQVVAPSYEFLNLRANTSVMKSLAEKTGGAYYEPPTASAMFSELVAKEAKAEIKVFRRIDLWNLPLCFSVFLAVLAAEWWLRKRWGLV